MDAGCKYVVCGGAPCSAWADAVDEAFVMATLDISESEYEQRFVMTTWHVGQPVDDVVHFFASYTNFGTHRFEEFLVLVLGDDEDVVNRLCESVRRQAPMP